MGLGTNFTSSQRVMFMTSAGGSARTAVQAPARSAAKAYESVFIRFSSSGNPGPMLPHSQAARPTLVVTLHVLARDVVIVLAGVGGAAARAEQSEDRLVFLADRIERAHPLQEAREVREPLGIAASARVARREWCSAGDARDALRNERDDARDIARVHGGLPPHGSARG